MNDNYDKMIDVSVTLSQDTLVYPGDPQPRFYFSTTIAQGGIANVGFVDHGLHHGTHVDAPYHFVDGAHRFNEMAMAHWVGPAYVVDATHEDKCITADTLKGVDMKAYQRILFKTKNSLDYYKRPEWYDDFIYLDKSACELMAENGVLTVGLDYLTVDPYGSDGYPAHNALFNNDMCIIECIMLDKVDPGEYYLMCLPLKFANTDGGNARVFLLKPGFCV